MPWIIDYSVVLEQMREQRFKSLYYNSGAFGFPADVATTVVGWIGADDSTIRPEMRELVVAVDAPYDEQLAKWLTRAWQLHLAGRAWVMPMSHWSYELDFGSREWMPALLERIGLDPGLLKSRTNAAAIEFAPDEADLFERFTARLLQMLVGSDFAIAFPRYPTLCTLHHHKQLWWTTAEPALADDLRRLIHRV